MIPDPCPQCKRGGTCNTPTCGRKRSSELMKLYGTAGMTKADPRETGSKCAAAIRKLIGEIE